MTDTRLPGGPQSRRAAMMCQNARFCLYLDAKRRATHGMTHADLPDGTHTETDAADYQRWERQQLQRRTA